MTAGFPDHFSKGAAGYATYRPSYPDALFRWLADQSPARALAWDCGTGSGQAAAGLARYYTRVIATDASAEQLRQAAPVANVEYRVASAERSDLDDHCADVITAATAVHWFDRPRFYAEVKRVAKPGGILAVWIYYLMSIDPAIDAVIYDFYRGPVGPYWPGERALVDERYRTIDFPFEELSPPAFAMSADWTLPQVLGYLRTWSAVGRYVEATGSDPIAELAPTLATLWSDPEKSRPVWWPLHARVGRV